MPARQRTIPVFDLHTHLPIQFPLVARPCEIPPWTAFNRGLMALANGAANFHRLRPRVSLSGAETASVSFASVLFSPADEVWGSCEPARNVMAQLRQVEVEVYRRRGWKIARNPGELRAAMDANQRCIVHCIEGGFSVGSPDAVPDLAAAGVAYVTLAHLFFRGVSACVNGIPFLDDARFSKLFPMPVEGLTAEGTKIAEAMVAHGIVIDVTHMTERAIHESAAIARVKGRPIVASHTAPRATSSEEYLLNLSDETMRCIRDTGGVIGVIAFKHWLHDPARPKERQDLTIMLRAIEHVRTIAGDDHVAIGCDLDGFIEPVEGLDRIANLGRLRNALLDAYSEDLAEKILWKNALRALMLGWSAARAPGRGAAAGV